MSDFYPGVFCAAASYKKPTGHYSSLHIHAFKASAPEDINKELEKIREKIEAEGFEIANFIMTRIPEELYRDLLSKETPG